MCRLVLRRSAAADRCCCGLVLEEAMSISLPRLLRMAVVAPWPFTQMHPQTVTAARSTLRRLGMGHRVQSVSRLVQFLRRQLVPPPSQLAHQYLVPLALSL